MSDNITIGISADSSKARADLKLLNAEISKTSAALREAVKAGDPAATSAQHQALQGLYQQQARATAVIKQNTAAKRENSVASKEAATGIGELAKKFGELSHAAGFAIPGLRALRAGMVAFVTVEVIRGFTAAVDKINELAIAAKEAGTTVGTIKALQQAFRAAGDDAAKAAPLLSSFNKAARELRLRPGEVERQASEAAAQAIAAGASQADAQEAAARIRRQAAARIPAPSEDPFGFLGIYPARYEQTIEGQRKLRADAAREVLRRKDTGLQIDETSIATARIFGQELEVIEPELRKIAAGALAITEPTKANVAVQDEYNKTVAAGVSWWDALTEAIGRAGQAVTVAYTNAQRFKEITGALPLLEQSASGPGGFATGGYIRGPGSGTSDSILARLSNGEFVMNAASVRRLGTGFLNGLNSFAGGGFVNLPPIRFAGGGLAAATAAGGTPVHLHLGAASFALGGPVDVVNALVKEAHGQQVRSAGVKPSWYAARPSGR